MQTRHTPRERRQKAQIGDFSPRGSHPTMRKNRARWGPRLE